MHMTYRLRQPHLVLLEPKKSHLPGFLLTYAFEQLYAAHHARKDDIDRNSKLNNKIAIICPEQTVYSAPLQPSRGASIDVFKTRLIMKPLITLFLPLFNLPTFKLPGLGHSIRHHIGLLGDYANETKAHDS